MIGAMPAVAVRHERRKQKTSKAHILDGKNFRPNHLNVLKAHHEPGAEDLDSPPESAVISAVQSRHGSRAGSPSPEDDPKHAVHFVRYGDECCDGKVSLLHFITCFFLTGITFVVIGAVQFKEEAGLADLKFHFLIIGLILIILGAGLAVIKWVWFRVAYPVYYGDIEDAAMLTALKKPAKKERHNEDEDQNASPKKVSDT